MGIECLIRVGMRAGLGSSPDNSMTGAHHLLLNSSSGAEPWLDGGDSTAMQATKSCRGFFLSFFLFF